MFDEKWHRDFQSIRWSAMHNAFRNRPMKISIRTFKRMKIALWLYVAAWIMAGTAINGSACYYEMKKAPTLSGPGLCHDQLKALGFLR